MRLKKLLLFSLILLGSSLPVSTLAATYTCGTNGVPNSCTPSGMQTLINSASNEDTINIATGTHAWTAQPTGVMLNKRITISGGGTYAVDANHNDVGTWPVQLNTRSEEHTSELQSQSNIVCRLLLDKKHTSQGRPQPGEALWSRHTAPLSSSPCHLADPVLHLRSG